MARLFPDGAPRLWCPLLTHYGSDGQLHRERIASHVRSLSPYVKGLLVAGSTGDGWELSPTKQQELLQLVLEVAAEQRLQVLAGMLRRDAEEARQAIVEVMDTLPAPPVCGFTVCPPTGQDLSQQVIRDQLGALLDVGAPTALYQLPQVTLNEMSPETVADLSARYANFCLFKDTSARDRVATAGLDLNGLILLRGAEGDYDRWLRINGGPYDGFLLSTANCFAERLHRMIGLLELGQQNEARNVIAPVEYAVARVFKLVSGLPQGNAFANANKAIDHYMAHGPGASQVAPPRLHTGVDLPWEVIKITGQVLAECGLMPKRGYCGG